MRVRESEKEQKEKRSKKLKKKKRKEKRNDKEKIDSKKKKRVNERKENERKKRSVNPRRNEKEIYGEKDGNLIWNSGKTARRLERINEVGSCFYKTRDVFPLVACGPER